MRMSTAEADPWLTDSMDAGGGDDGWGAAPGGDNGWGTTAREWLADPGDDQWNPDYGKLYSEATCLAALRGEQHPTEDLNDIAYPTSLCILRGIRYHHGFASELRNAAGHPEFTRALNARAIMSNEIPDMTASDEFPYCIWYPDVALKSTYRELAKRYPQMRYQAGRACAVAGYSDLYKELQLLPDVAIAEEARDSVMRSQQTDRDSGRGSQEIFQHIRDQPVRWQVMNDYTRHVELDSPLPARHGLNGDAAVVSILKLKRSFGDLRRDWRRFRDGNSRLSPPCLIDSELAPAYFNITEDWSIDEYTSQAEAEDQGDRGAKRPESEEMTELLWNPLPIDLPWGDKDLLILMAAYHGDVDRYARLRRPHHVSQTERNCVCRGIYHSTMFAKWWSLQPDAGSYASYITARFIMSNDLSRITEDTPDSDLPQQIWYPSRASAVTYVELALRKPAMSAAVSRALIVLDDQEAWDRVDVEPYHELMVEAKASPNPYYLDTLRKRCVDRGLDPDELEYKYPESLGVAIGALAENESKPLDTNLAHSLSLDMVAHDSDNPGIYDGWSVDVSQILLFAAAPKELRPPQDFSHLDLSRLYHEQRHQPPSDVAESDAYSPRSGAWRGRGGRGSRSGMPWGNGRSIARPQ